MTTVLVVGLVRPAQMYVVRRYHTGGRTQSDHRLGVVRSDEYIGRMYPKTPGLLATAASHWVVDACVDHDYESKAWLDS